MGLLLPLVGSKSGVGVLPAACSRIVLPKERHRNCPIPMGPARRPLPMILVSGAGWDNKFNIFSFCERLSFLHFEWYIEEYDGRADDIVR